jgi:hypothetical protein
MSSTAGGEGIIGAELNPHDPLAPHRDNSGVCHDKGWLIEEARQFMNANPEVVACMEQFATVLVGATEGANIASQDIIQLPDLVPNADSRRQFPGSAPDEPIVGLQLAFDSQVKHVSEDRYFVHSVNSTLYEAVHFPGTEGPTYYDAFGLIAADDSGSPLEYGPEFALAFPNDRRYAAIVQRVSAAELRKRQEMKSAEKMAYLARSQGERQRRDNYSRLRGDIRDGLLSGGLSYIGERALVLIMGANGLQDITATEEERRELEPLHIPEEALYAAKALLDALTPVSHLSTEYS